MGLGGLQGGSVAPRRDPTLLQCGQSGIGGACRVAVRRAVGGIAVGGEAAIAGSRLAGWLGRTMARPYYVGEEGRWGRHCCGSPWRVACEGRWGRHCCGSPWRG